MLRLATKLVIENTIYNHVDVVKTVAGLFSHMCADNTSKINMPTLIIKTMTHRYSHLGVAKQCAVLYAIDTGVCR